MNFGFVLPGVESVFNRVFGEALQESRKRNKHREIEKDWKKERVEEIHKMGSVTIISNEIESGKTWGTTQQGWGGGWAAGERLNVLNNRGPEIISRHW